jgi:Tol biopolymer transport system component
MRTAAATATSAAVVEETPAVSQDGRYVAFTASQEEHVQVFLRDTCEGATSECKQRTILLSAAEDGSAANGDSRSPSMSSDGRFVSFSSGATNLVTSAPAGRQVYLRDTCIGAASSCAPSTQLISADSNGALVGTESILPSISASGRFVAFLAVTPSHAASQAKGQASTQANKDLSGGYRQVFVRDTCFGAVNCTPSTTRISLQPGDASSSDEKPAGPAISGTAKHIAAAGARTSTLFTRSVAVDDDVFLAITNKHP